MVHPKLEALRALWEAKRRDGLMPARGDFDVFELRPWLGHVSLIDVIDGGEDFLYRLHGSNLVKILGMELTGRRLSELPAHMESIVRAEHLQVLERREPVYFHRMRFNRDNDHRLIVRLSLPLATDGCTIDMLLSSVYLDD